MTTAALVLAAGGGTRFDGATHKLRADLAGQPVLGRTLDSVLDASFDEVILVVGEDDYADVVGDSTVTTVVAADWADGQAHSLAAGLAHAEAMGHDAVVVGLGDQPLVGAASWEAVRAADGSPIAAANFGGRRRPPTRLAREVWGQTPKLGDAGARALFDTMPELVTDVVCTGDPIDVDTTDALARAEQRFADERAVRELLGRTPMGYYEVVARDAAGAPTVLKNFPVLADGRPMPTLYWLCGDRESMLIGRLEAMKGVRRAEADLGLDVVNAIHERYALERDAWLDESGIEVTHRPTGGVGGTRNGLKCLHAHYGYWLAGGDDPVGQWVEEHLHEVDSPHWPARP